MNATMSARSERPPMTPPMMAPMGCVSRGSGIGWVVSRGSSADVEMGDWEAGFGCEVFADTSDRVVVAEGESRLD